MTDLQIERDRLAFRIASHESHPGAIYARVVLAHVDRRLRGDKRGKSQAISAIDQAATFFRTA